MPGDFSQRFGVFRDIAYRSLIGGRLPLWAECLDSGYPFYADPQAQLFYPPVWVIFGLMRLQGWGNYPLGALVADGFDLAQADSLPAGRRHTTDQWAPGRDVIDPHILALPVDLPAGDYQLEVGLYLLATRKRLGLTGSAGPVGRLPRQRRGTAAAPS